MKSLSLQGEFIKQHCGSLLGAVYFGVAGPGGKGKEESFRPLLPSKPSKSEKKGGKGGKGAEILPAPLVLAEERRELGRELLTQRSSPCSL